MQKNQKIKGKIIFYDNLKKFGFVKSGSIKYYFHERNISGDVYIPKKNDTVEFIPTSSNEKSPVAKKVKILESEVKEYNLNNINPKKEIKESTKEISYKNNMSVCKSCNKTMTPRLVTYKGMPEKSYCPHCGSLHMRFANPYSIIGTIITVIVILFILSLVLK